MANITLQVDSHTHNKTVLINSTDKYNLKEKIEISTLKDTDSIQISTVEFSESSGYTNIINLILTKHEFSQFMQLAQKLL